MLGWLKTNVESARKKLADEVSKFRNKEFMQAVVCGCALVSAADGNVGSAEKQKMVGFMRNSEELKAFDIEEVIKYFNSVVSKFEFDHAIGKAEALKVIGGLRSKTDAARLLVRVCLAIGAADGSFDKDEQAICREICRELGLDPAEFDL